MPQSNVSDDELLMDLVISSTELENGISPVRIARSSSLNMAFMSAGVEVTPLLKSPDWSEDEVTYLRSMSDKLTSGQIAEHLGRTEIAVSVKRKRLHLPEPSTAKTEFYTANYIANLMGLDAHKICFWVDNGMLEGIYRPGPRKIRLVRRIRFLCWVTNPKNWIYFNPRKIADPKLARMLELRAERWGDEWWSTRQVGDYHGVSPNQVLNHINRGLLPGVRVEMSRAGRHADPKWLNSFVRKSDAIKHVFWTMQNKRPCLTPRAEAWIMHARDVLGLNWTQIGARMGPTWHRKRTTGPGIDGYTVRKHYERIKAQELRNG